MFGLLLFLLLAAVGIFVVYRFSTAAKLKKRIEEALSSSEDLESEARGLQQNLKSETESLTNQYVQGIYAVRLKAISIDDLKKYATGMRLQALKDIGITAVADLQGWNESRISQVRGVGPKSASAIFHSVATATANAKAIPIPHPSPPFSNDSERQLMQALYRQRWFNSHVSDQLTAFTVVLVAHQCTRDAILAKTTFAHWLWKFGANRAIRLTLEQGNSLIEASTDQRFVAMKEKLSKELTDYRTICVNRVPVESIIQDFNQDRTFYDSFLTTHLGPAAGNRAPEVPRSQPTPANSPALNVIHVQSGHDVPGPPPEPTEARDANSGSPVIKTQKPEILFSVSVGSVSDHGSTEFSLPPPPRSMGTSDLRWLREGEAIQIQGHNLSHGFIYVGKGINDEQYYAVDPRLSAKPGDLTSADADRYFSYSWFSPEHRLRYLTWLAGGASAPTDASFGMLYFYGIERRSLDLLENRIPNPPSGELEQLLLEGGRLANLFKDRPGSVSQCCLRLSDFATACTLDRTAIPQLPKKWVKTWELPFIIRYGLGWFIKDRQPIPVEWALRWVYVEPAIYLRTPAVRCPQEFEAAFAAVYRKKFGDGLVVPANKTKLKLTYQPGWPMHFGREIRHEFPGIPDVAAVTAPQQSLRAVVEEATAEIDGYSRYLGRNPAKSGSLEAYLNLAFSLWPPAAAERWRRFVTSHVEPIQPMSLKSLLVELGLSGDLGQAKIPEITANLSRALVGFEPDILSGARRPKPSEMIVLFPTTSESGTARATLEYKKASLIISLSACVALADGLASEDEAAAVEGMIASWQHLHVDIRTRLCAQYRLQVCNKVSLASLKSRFTGLTPEGRTQLANSLCSLAAADGNIAAAEVKLLEQIYRTLDLDPKLLYSHLHPGTRQVESQSSSISSEPPIYRVDAARLAALRRETDQVSSLLAEVFADDEPPSSSPAKAPSPGSAEAKSSDDVLLPGLGSKHERFLAQLLRKPSWTREELLALAAQSQIMLDGALERINDAAFDLIGEPITEGDDPIYVQQTILEATK